MKRILTGICAFSMLFLSLGAVKVRALDEENAADNQHEIVEDNVENNESDVNQNEEAPVVQFNDEKVTITFELDGGTMDQTVYEVDKGAALGFIPTPQKEGYKFVYWFYDEEFNDYFQYTRPINEDTIVYAKWSKLVDTNEISQDLLDFVYNKQGLDGPYSEDDFEQVQYLSLRYSYYDYDTDEQKSAEIKDLKGIEYFKNITALAVSIDLENELDPVLINDLKKLENLSRVDFSGLVPTEIEFGDWNELEKYNAEIMSDINNVNNYENQVIGLLMQLNYNTDHDQAHDNAVEITFQHTINLSNLTFLEPLNQINHKFKIELAHAELGKTIIVEPEFVTRNGEDFVRISFDNPVLLAYYGADEKLVFDKDYKYLRTDMYSDLRINFYDDMTDEEYDKLTEPAIIEYIDINGIRHVLDPEDYDQEPKFKSVDIFITRAQYDHLVRVNNDPELGLEFMNSPGLISTVDTNQDIPFEDTVDGGGTLPNENLSYYFGYRVMMNLDEQPPVKETYTVTFDSKGGTAVSPILDVEKGSTITKPTDPTNGDKIFKGWFTVTDVEWDFTTDTVESDLTLYAKWEDAPIETYTVTFDSKGGTAVSPILDVEKGSTITKPTDPTNGDKIFKGWFTATDVEWNFTSHTVESDLTLYAKWEDAPIETYTVTFDSKGGTAVSPILDVEKGSTITKPTDPTNGDKIFKGWFTVTDVEWDFTTDTVESDLTLYAKWEDAPIETYTVTFDSKGGTAVSPILDVEKGSTITKPTDPTNGDKIFKGWFTATDVEWNFTSHTVESDLTLYAKWEDAPIETYTVTFDSKGGTAVSPILDVEKGSTITKPTDPTNGDKIFKGWFTATDVEWNFTSHTVESDLTLYAKWEDAPIETYTVTFDSKGGTAVSPILDVEKGSTITKPTDPTNGDKIFKGWFTATDVEWNFTSHTVESDLTLYAKWEDAPIETYTVTFDSKGGTAVSPIPDVEKGSTITKPTDPTNGDKIFKGWFTVTDVEWDFTTDTVESDLTLYAKWEDAPIETYTVTFDSKGGTAVSPILDVEKGSTITKPTDPTKDNLKFLGWYTEDGTAWDFSSDVVESNITLYAKWDETVLPPTGLESNNWGYVVTALGLCLITIKNKVKKED